ncbi:MAG TPA: heavy metal-binding domain-containing protein [Candidatus Solibacter sp.]|nr:heavy metal-binding domain-containing protein [Candidatus Solibacter sp.]
MIVATTENIAAHDVIETKGQVFGLIVRSRGLAGNLAATLRSIGGGEIHEYTRMLEDSRRQAIDRMIENATAMGANAVTMMRFDSSEIGQSMAEVVAYGTAVVVQPKSGG